MASPPVLVDTSCWVEYFREPDTTVSNRVAALIREDRVYINGVILTELLHGARTEAEARRVRSALAAVEWIESEVEVYARAGRLGFDLRRRGVTVPITDCIIAAGAESVGAHIFTLDGHFEELAKVASFELVDSPSGS